MKPFRLSIAQAICRYLPPLIGHKTRRWIYPQPTAFADNYAYTTTAQTGSPFTSTTADFHGYPFAACGYLNWRAWALALAVCAPGDTIIEIGANIGTETIGFADIVGPQGRVYAFEPLPANVQALTRALEQHRYDNVIVFPAALSDKNETVYFKTPGSRHLSGVGHIVNDAAPRSIDTIEVTCHTLDSLQDEIGPAAFIFIDAEGAEHSILNGGRAYLRDHDPVLVLEAGAKQLAHYGLTPHDLYTQLASLDYAVFDIARFGLTPVAAESFKPATSNWLGVPRARRASILPRARRYLRLSGWLPCLPYLNPLTRPRRPRA